LDLNQAVEAGPNVCGGKGWNLGRLARFGFPVPAGGVLVADAYTRFMAAPAIQDWCQELADVSAEVALDPAVAKVLEHLRDEIEEGEIPSDVEVQLRAFLERSGLVDVPIAVRSSATAEDGASDSFAGVHASVLDVCGSDDALRAIKTCYSSVWTIPALTYRRRLEMPDDQVACAVVLCAMVGRAGGETPASGVAFSCDPLTGRRDRVVISGLKGLGQTVSGRVNPEEIAVQLDPGPPQVAVRIPGDGKVLSDERALELARLAVRVEWALGSGQDPQDIEWVQDGRQFWLLQARPATRVTRPRAPAIAHVPVIWSNANFKDSLPGVVSTLGWSLIRRALWPLLFATTEAVGSPPPPGLEPARRFSGRAYFDLSSLQWAYYDALGVLPEETNRSLGGHQPTIPVPSKNPFRGRDGWTRLRANAQAMLALLFLPRSFPKEMAQVKAFARELKHQYHSRRSNAELLASMGQASKGLRDYCARFELTDTGGIWQLLLASILERWVGTRGQALAAALMAGSGHLTSAEHGYRLGELAASARSDESAQIFFEHLPLDPLGWKDLPATSPFRKAFERFLSEFGHRGVYEADIANPRWNEDPSYLLEQVGLVLREGGEERHRQRATAQRAAADAEVAKLAFWKRLPVRWLAAQARQMAALREAGKSALVAPLEPLRAIALEVGRRLTSAADLAEPNDIFHLAREEAEAFLRGEWDGSGAGALVAHRKQQAKAWELESPPDVIFEQQASTSLQSIGSCSVLPPVAHSANGATRLSGLGVAAGRAAGKARVLRNPADGYRLHAGDVLIAPSTDPGWTPLFLRAAAVVTEVGGYLSHGAIVAREYGLPAVANIPGLLEAVHDGENISVNGDTGEVLIHDG
jgi:pyruvate,water dikinase